MVLRSRYHNGIIGAMNLLDYFNSLESQEAKKNYAEKAGTTLPYLVTHIFVPQRRRKIPRKRLVLGLAKASDGVVSLDDVLEFLYKTEIDKAA